MTSDADRQPEGHRLPPEESWHMGGPGATARPSRPTLLGGAVVHLLGHGHVDLPRSSGDLRLLGR